MGKRVTAKLRFLLRASPSDRSTPPFLEKQSVSWVFGETPLSPRWKDGMDREAVSYPPPPPKWHREQENTGSDLHVEALATSVVFLSSATFPSIPSEGHVAPALRVGWPTAKRQPPMRNRRLSIGIESPSLDVQTALATVPR